MHVLLISNCHFHTELNFKLSSRGSSSSLSESSSRSGDPQGSDGPASRVVTWAVCFERLLEDHVGVRYFTVRFNADFYEANVGITLIFLVIFQHEHLSEWSSLINFTWLSRHLFLFFIIEYQILSSGFWGTFICSSLNHHCMTSHYVLIIKLNI